MNQSSFSADTFFVLNEIPPDPSPGAELARQLPQAGQVELVLISFKFVTDANADNRIVYLNFNDGSNIFRLGSASFAHTASKTFHYIGHQNAITNAAGNVQDLMIPLPFFRMAADPGFLNISITDRNVGDQISDVRVSWKLWRGRG